MVARDNQLLSGCLLSQVKRVFDILAQLPPSVLIYGIYGVLLSGEKSGI